ncbi:MAG: hypothetical protein NT028_04270, partial [candidate division Zixibacteria bacterium]|nr:hypothetical protein [candidate division Zixibacteria bacterium]
MKQKDRSLLYLLTFTMLLFSFSSIFAAVTVTYVNGGPFPYNRTGQTITAFVVTDVNIASFDLITKVQSTLTGAFGRVTDISIQPPLPDIAIPPLNPDLTNADGVLPDDFTRFWGFKDVVPIIMPAATYTVTFTVTTSCAIGQFILTDGGAFEVDPVGPVIATTAFVNTLPVPGYETVTQYSGTTTPLGTYGTYTVVNETPAIVECPASFSLDGCRDTSYEFAAIDPDLQYSCPPATDDQVWSLLLPKPDGAAITAGGFFTFTHQLGAAALGPKVISVVVTDEFLKADTCVFTITVL